MDALNEFYNKLKENETVTLATSGDEGVTMRVVSPVMYNNKVLFFTNKDSLKYKQLTKNSNCCIGIDTFFAEAKAELLGSTMLDENAELRTAYEGKFPGAFDEGIPFGGRNSDFVLLTLNKLRGWTFASEDKAQTNGIPTLPFSIDIK